VTQYASIKRKYCCKEKWKVQTIGLPLNVVQFYIMPSEVGLAKSKQFALGSHACQIKFMLAVQ